MNLCLWQLVAVVKCMQLVTLTCGESNIPFILTPPQAEPCIYLGGTGTITCVTKQNVTSGQMVTINANQQWVVVFSNQTELFPLPRSSDPTTFPPGWSVDSNIGLTISDAGLDLNKTTLQCIAVGASGQTNSDTVQLIIGAEPGAFSCVGFCSLTACDIDCLEPKTESCARVTTTSMTVSRKGITVQELTRIGSKDVDFPLNGLSPDTEYLVTIRADNIAGYNVATVTVFTKNGSIKPKSVAAKVSLTTNELGISKQLQVSWTPSENSVISYNVRIESAGEVSSQVIVDGTYQSIEQPVDSLPSCLGGVLLNYTATVTATNSMGESEEESTENFVIGYLTRSTSLQFVSSTQGSITVNVSCHLSATPTVPGSVGCEVCQEDGKSSCYTFVSARDQMTVTGQATFSSLNEDEPPMVYTYRVYAVNGSSTRLDDCVYAQSTYNASATSDADCGDTLGIALGISIPLTVLTTAILSFVLTLLAAGCLRGYKRDRNMSPEYSYPMLDSVKGPINTFFNRAYGKSKKQFATVAQSGDVYESAYC